MGLLVAHFSLLVKNVKEFVALARVRPGEIVYGLSGTGSYVRLAMAVFSQMTGTRVIPLPCKGGGPAVVALASGKVQR